MCSDFVLIKYDDGVFHYTKESNIKASPMGGHVVKWKSAWYGAKILCKGSKELCQSLYLSLKLNLPRVEIQDILDHNSAVWYKWDDIGDSENNNKNSSELPMVDGVFIDSNFSYQSCDGILNTSLESTNLTDDESDAFHNSDADPDYEVESSISSTSISEEDSFGMAQITVNKNSSQPVVSKIQMQNVRGREDSIKKQLPLRKDTGFDNSSADPDYKIEPSCSSWPVSKKDTSRMNLDENDTPQMASNFFLKDIDKTISKSSPNSVLMVNSNSFSQW
ncbi:hypothetical protein WA026_019556 [Henosepilachna vigintioctopunctata]|uniref:Uncharacterized protein n=1 Tax=Henosepilachna vigintioctopunctata TaxID=420089 RepID=A0AAW1U086_9CUCU